MRAFHHKVTALTIQVAGIEEGAAASTEASVGRFGTHAASQRHCALA